MTDRPHSEPEGRLDLGALGAEPDPARENAVVQAVLSRIGARERAEADELVRLRSARRWMLAAAAVLAAIATASVVAAPRRGAGGQSDDVIAEWAQSNHIPTNGELLAAFHGYRP